MARQGRGPASRLSRRSLLGAAAALGLGGLAAPATAGGEVPAHRIFGPTLPSRRAVLERFAGRTPRWFGLEGAGVVSSLPSEDAVVLTFDACGGPQLRYDEALVEVLRRHEAPATLFLNRQWALANWRVVGELHDDPLFELANHGDRHVPLSVDGAAAYGITGTADVGEAYDEIARAHRLFQLLWNHRCRWFRPGTAHVDDVAAALAEHVGTPVVGFTVNADLGATAAADQVEANLLQLAPGGIALGHLNRPGSGTAAGVEAAIPQLRDRGLRLGRLGDLA